MELATEFANRFLTPGGEDSREYFRVQNAGFRFGSSYDRELSVRQDVLNA